MNSALDYREYPGRMGSGAYFTYSELEELETLDKELEELESEGAVNCRSPDSIRWVQQLLNKVMGLQLAVDSKLGSATRSAIRSFPQKYGLFAGGLPGPKTEVAVKTALGEKPGAVSITAPIIATSSCTNAVIDRTAGCILSNQNSPCPIRHVSLIGYTDPVGSVSYNERLGQRRAEFVRNALRARLDATRPGLSRQILFMMESRGETQQIPRNPTKNRRVEPTLTAAAPRPQPLPRLSDREQTEYNQTSPQLQEQFNVLHRNIETHTNVARREAERGSRALLQRGVFRALPGLLPELLKLAKLRSLPSGWSLSGVLPLLVGNTLYNLAFPETINQCDTDCLAGRPAPTCFSASTQILLVRRFPATYVRYVNQLAETRRITFAGGGSLGPLTFISTSLYKSPDSVLLQTAFDIYFKIKAIQGSYTPGDELKVHRQVFGSRQPPQFATWGTKTARVAAFRKAFITNGGNTRLWEIANLSVGNPKPCGKSNHTAVVTRISNGQVYFYNPWANEEKKKQYVRDSSNEHFGRWSN